MRIFNANGYDYSIPIEFHDEAIEDYILQDLSDVHSKMPAFNICLERYGELLERHIKLGNVYLNDLAMEHYYKIKEIWTYDEITITRG
ncbi:hypothetical protein [Vibrio phage VCPH]|nr:hypothetical protein [Vibrio phage VCPH]